MHIPQKSIRGFTLVELAVAMIIIGLLIGGIFKGQEIIHSSRINKVIKDLEGYNAAFHSFRDIYRGLPGDLQSATARIIGCDTTTNCANGNGSGRISDNNPTTPANPGWNTSIATWPEPFQAWKHMSLAGVITGVDSSASFTNLGWGKSHPASILGGGYEIYYDPYVTTLSSTTASGGTHLIRLSAGGVTGGPIAQNGSSPLTPEEAFVIDSKIDDGNGNGGWVAVEDAGNVCVLGTSGEYNLQNDSKDCILYYFLH